MDTISHALENIRSAMPAIIYRLDEPMKDHTSFRIGGAVRVMYFPRTPGEFAELYGLAREFDIRIIIIGNGTNMLVNDSIPGTVVIKTTGLDTIARSGDYDIKAGAGVSLTQLSEYACKNGLTGLEFAYGIPGSAGGAVSMNAGAYGSEMKDVISSTDAYSPEKGMISITGEQHGFIYRGSRFSDSGDIVLSSALRLEIGDEKSIKAKMKELSARRRETQPLDIPSAGSTFKRPADGYAAALIEQSGLKGYTVGGAQVSEKHAGFIVNRGGAAFSDVMRLIGHVQETVYKQFGVELEPEVKIVK